MAGQQVLSKPEAAADTVPELSIRDATVNFGGTKAVDRVSLSVACSARVGLIGPNGAGKSTLLKAIAGEVGLAAGEIRFRGEVLARSPNYRRARLGIVRTRQELGLFMSMTVLENVLFGADNPVTGRDFRQNPAEQGRLSARAKRRFAEEVMDLVGITDWEEHVVSSIPYGTRKLVELARAIAARPRLLLLDEPVAGLNTHEKAAMAERLSVLVSRLSMTLLLVEHDMKTVADVCPDAVYAMAAGRIIASGAFDQVMSHPEVVEAYFGSSVDSQSGMATA